MMDTTNFNNIVLDHWFLYVPILVITKNIFFKIMSFQRLLTKTI